MAAAYDTPVGDQRFECDADPIVLFIRNTVLAGGDGA
jgi:hypothetical protein